MLMKTRVFLEIEEVPEALWEEIRQNRSCTLSHVFWGVIQAGKLNDFSYRYLVAYDDRETPVGAMAAYVVTTDIAIFAPPFLRGLLEKVRRFIPGFLKWRMLECGTPININSPPWVCPGGKNKERVRDVLLDSAIELAKLERVLVSVFRDFDDASIPEQQRMRSLGYEIVDGLPNAVLDLPWRSMSAYLNAMRSYYRSKLMKHVRRCEDVGVTYKVTDKFSELADVLCHQWLVVHANAKEFQREVLTPEFYRELSDAASIDSRVVLLYKDGSVVAHALILFDGALARWMYFGREAVANDSLYLYAAYAVIEASINAGAVSLELGVTNYQTKLDLGARIVPLKFAIGIWNSRLNPIAGWVYNLLNKLPEPKSRDVFKKFSSQ